MELAVVIGNRHAGTLHLPSGADPSFEYHPEYIGRPGPPLSAQFPLSARRAEGEKLRWWLEGLLPDDTETIRSLLREHDLQSRDYAQMLGAPMGADCAGAVQFSPPAAVSALTARQGKQTPITEAEIAEWLRQVQADPARRAYRGKGADSGFSLAGMQPKIAVRRTNDSRWAVPQGATPTTHIIKAARHQMLPHEATTEHLIMETAARCGLAAARTSTADFELRRLTLSAVPTDAAHTSRPLPCQVSKHDKNLSCFDTPFFCRMLQSHIQLFARKETLQAHIRKPPSSTSTRGCNYVTNENKASSTCHLNTACIAGTSYTSFRR